MSGKDARARRRLRREESALQLTDDQVNELKDAFTFINGGEGDSLSKSQLKKILAELGLKADAATVEEMFKEADSTKSGAVTFPMFLSMMSSRMMQVDSEDNLIGAFKIFDPEVTGYINSDKLKEALTTTGEPLTAAEWQELKDLCVKGGRVDYMLFVNTLFAKKL
mmetsp:Transcript_32992/g.80939  ORF Transcript_32992/g.80939 Transcript_32992/m.80939 type:complete len:166 (-) Transcript_32992:104-601(-)